jgi:Bacterial SH3 domain
MSFARLGFGSAILGSAIVLLLSTNLAAAKSVTVVADVNLRQGPGTANDVITLIPKGTMVEVGTCANGWCQVNFNGQDGYSIATNLGIGGPVRRPMPAYPPLPDDVYPPYPPPAYVVGPPVFYGPAYYGPCCYYGGYGFRGGWRHRW